MIPEVDIADIRNFLNELSYDKCKISCLANCLTQDQEFVQTDALSPMLKEKHFGTKYRKFCKPPL